MRRSPSLAGRKPLSPHFSTLCDTVLSLDSSWSKCSLWTSLFMKTSASKADRQGMLALLLGFFTHKRPRRSHRSPHDSKPTKSGSGRSDVGVAPPAPLRLGQGAGADERQFRC